jgi:imidazolonepropionase
MGFDLKIHADELSAMGGAELAAELGATSADHLLRTDAAGAEALAAAGTVAVLLPQTIFTLRSPYRPPVKDMIAAGVPIAIATDFNPGTSPAETMTMVMALGWQELGLSLGQVWPAVTVNAAHAIGLEGVVGALEAGMAADFVLWNADSPEFVCYRVGANLVNQVYVAGKQVVRDGCPLISEQ